MKLHQTSLIACCALLLAACSSSQKYDSAREWQRAECNKVIDKEDRDRCLRRVDGDFGRRSDDPAPPARR